MTVALQEITTGLRITPDSVRTKKLRGDTAVQPSVMFARTENVPDEQTGSPADWIGIANGAVGAAANSRFGSRARSLYLTGVVIIAAVGGATLLRLAIMPLVGPAIPFSAYFVTAVLFAWYRGIWSAVAAILLSACVGAPLALGSMADRSAYAAIFGFVLTSALVSFLIEIQHRTLRRAKDAELAQSIVANENARLLKEAKFAAIELQQTNDELRRANGDLELFAYSASHDFREPLRTISLLAQSLKREASQHDIELNIAEQIIIAASRMDALMRDVMTYIGTAKGGSERPPVIDSGRVLSEVLDCMRASISDSGAVITFGELPELAIDENRLGQVFQNLISNAIKYRSHDPLRIHIDASQADEFWIFSVIDNGIGIDPRFSKHIFGLFKRLHAQSEYQGNGIGLAICQRIVEQCGGNIWLTETESGRGSRFCFSIPNRASSQGR